MLVNEAIDQFLTSCRADGLQPSTVKTYSRLLVQFRKRFGLLDVRAVPVMSIREFLIERRVGLSPFSIIDEVATIKRLFSWCAAEYDGFRNPTINIKRPRAPKFQPKGANPSDVAAILATCDASAIGLRDRALFLTLADTGIRASELLGATDCDLDFGRSRLRVRGKGQKERFVPLSRETMLALVRWLNKRPFGSDHLFCVLAGGRPGSGLTYSGLREILRRRCRAAKITHRFTVQMLRHLLAE